MGENGSTELRVGDANEAGKSYVAGIVSAPVSDLRLKVIDEDRVAVALVAHAKPDGTLYNKDLEPKGRSTAMLYDSLMVRHWDQFVTSNRNAIFHGVIHKGRPHITESKGRYSLGDLTNILKGSKLESPVAPFGGTDHFDLSVRGVGFIAKDPELNPALNTKSNFYFVKIDISASATSYSPPSKIEVKLPEVEESTEEDEGFEEGKGPDGNQILEGASTSPALEPNGEGAAFLQMRQNGYESDKNRIVLVDDVVEPKHVFEILKSNSGEGLWERSPSSIMWSADGKVLYLTAEEKGKTKLFKLDVPKNPVDMTLLPEAVTDTGSVSDIHTIGTDGSKLFISGSNFLDSSTYSILDPAASSSVQIVSSYSQNGSFFGLAQDQISDIWFDGAGDQKVHAWVVKPSNFKEGKKYPLAYLIHGGPQGAWTDTWSTRWNPAVFAEQGYVVIAPNPTGSTGYGQGFTDAIQMEWGGLPYEDLVKGFEYIKANVNYVDTERSVALGASYGGYMMAWMQGHDLSKQFKAMVCHDGSFNVPAQLSTDELYFPIHEFGGRLDHGKKANWEKWNPTNHINEWETPMLVIHSEKDYRLPISEGLAMFNVLQTRGVESRFLSFPDENHWVLNEENSLVWHTVVLNWINKHVGLPPYKDEAEAGIVVQN